MAPDAERWNERYRALDNSDCPQACEVLEHYRHLLPHRGQALDIACGSGGNALLLAAHGLSTSAWDYSAVAIDKLRQHAEQQDLHIHTEIRDVTAEPPTGGSFDVIVVSHYLERGLCDSIIDALKPGGLLFYQTFTVEKVTDNGPANPDYRLAPNELLSLFAGLRVVFYREEGHLGDLERGFRDRVQFIGCKSP
ncbi:MAG: class I SAM-dependent methyltransferase [Gammaproteobacteria bacterium]|nr:class I SAM-dependent methyltransferase [Gammaproteobacteria bacterium]